MKSLFGLFSSVMGIWKNKLLSRWVILGFDVIISFFSTVLALSVVLLFLEGILTKPIFFLFVLISVPSSLLGFFLLKTHSNVIRHSAFTEVVRIACSAFIKVIILYSIYLIITDAISVRRAFLLAILDFGFTFFSLSIFRALLILGYRYFVYNINSANNRALIYFDETASQNGAASFIQTNQNKYKILGYISIGERKNMRVGNYRVFFAENEDDFNTLRKSLSFTTVIFTSANLVKGEKDRLLRFGERNKVKMLLLPPADELKKGWKKLHNIPEILIEDLLGRDEIKINMDEIHNSLKGKVVMVTGAAGSIGSELCRQLCTFELKELILFDSAETPMHNIRLELEEKYPNVHFEPVMGDVRMTDRIDSVFRRFKPQYVFHAAAYKHVPLMEENPCEAVHTNVYGTRIVADAAVKYGVEKFIMVSTDKAVNPTNVMGASKRLAEIYVQSLSIAISKGEIEGKTKFITTRFGNVLGSNGSVIPRFREQLLKGGPLTVTHPDIIRYFMTIPEACRLVLEAAFMGKGNEIFVFDMGTPVKIANLARRMIELAGLVPDKDIKIVYTGLRPGEKLYEELLATKENTLPTDNKQIFRAQVREYEYNHINEAIDNLTDLAIRVEKMETVRMMKQIVPEFKSRNSVYEELDINSNMRNQKLNI